jgi:hypothetical protein
MAVYAHASKITSPILRNVHRPHLNPRPALADNAGQQLFNLRAADRGHVTNQHAVGGVKLCRGSCALRPSRLVAIDEVLGDALICVVRHRRWILPKS